MYKALFLLTLIFSLIPAREKQTDEYIFTEGKGKVEVRPNLVEMNIGVSTINFSADSALINTNRITDTILVILKKYGVEDKDIETFSSSFLREYKDTRDTSTYLGIKSEHILKVKFFKVEKFETLLNEMIGKGMNVLNYYKFKHTEEDSLKRVSAQLAFIDAQKNAKAIAEKSDRTLGRLLNVSYEKPQNYRIQPDFKIELSRKLIGSLMGGDGGSLNLRKKQDLKFLRIIIPTIKYTNEVFTKFQIN